MENKQLIDIVEKLSDVDKLVLLQLIADDLVKNSELTRSENIATSHGLHDSFEAAAILSRALAEKKAALHDR